jgi:hypothetical protein
LAWRVANTFAPVNSVAVLVEATRGATTSETTPVVLADAGVENVNAQVDALIATGVLRRVLAFTELKFSNSMIEAFWRSFKHQWLFLHSLDSVTTVRRLVEFYVQEHNQVLPHSAFRGQTPDELYFGRGDAVPADLISRRTVAFVRRSSHETSRACRRLLPLGAAKGQEKGKLIDSNAHLSRKSRPAIVAIVRRSGYGILRLRVTEDREPGWTRRVRFRLVPSSENASHHILVRSWEYRRPG